MKPASMKQLGAIADAYLASTLRSLVFWKPIILAKDGLNARERIP